MPACATRCTGTGRPHDDDPYRPRSFVRSCAVIGLVLAGSLLAGRPLQAADLKVRAYVDRTIVGMNQQFTLSVELSGKDINEAGNPELPELSAFAAYLGSGSSQNMQIINGRMSVSHTTNYYFQATKEGRFEIGAVTVKAGGEEYRTDPIAIEVKKATAGTPVSPGRPDAPTDAGPSAEDLFVRALVNKRRVFQNEPVVITYKIYTRINVTSFGFTKLPGTTGFWVEEFDIGNQPRTSTEVYEGKQYTVATIKRMALFPMSPGTKEIEPLGVQCEVRVRSSRRSRDIFDDFFNDSIFGRTVRKSIQSPSVRVEVLPLPEEGKPDGFSGIVGSLNLTGSVDKTRVKTNEAISYRLKIEGRGNIRMLPDPRLSFPADFETYAPKISESLNRSGSVISGIKTYEYVIIPRVPGLQKIKPFSMPVFDPETGIYKILTTPEFIIDVEKGEETFTSVPMGLSKEEVRLLGRDIRFIKTANPAFRRRGDVFYKHAPFWLVILLPMMLLTGAFALRRHQDRMMVDVAYARDRRANRSAMRRLAQARSLMNPEQQEAFYAEVGRAIVNFLGDKLNTAGAGLAGDDVKQLLKNRGVGENLIEAVLESMRVCDMKRFSPTVADEAEMKQLYEKAVNVITRLEKEIKRG